MKTIITIIVALLIGLSTQAQEQCKDVIYPKGGEAVIFNCCIQEVSDGDLVLYLLDEEYKSIRANSVIKDGVTLELKPVKSIAVPTYNSAYPHDYNYYKELARRSKNQRDVGSALTIAGFGCQIVGIVLLADDNRNNDGAGQGLYWGGFVSWSVGLPLWISGGVKHANNKRAMESVRQRDVSLNLGTTSNGVGLILSL